METDVFPITKTDATGVFVFSVTFSRLDPMGFLLGKKQAVLRCPSYLGLTKSANISIPIKPTMLGDLFFVGDLFNGSLSYGMKIPMSRQPPFGRICMFGSPFRSHRTVADPSFFKSMKF